MDDTGAASAKAGSAIYAVGDIHGRRDLLDKLLVAIDEDADRAQLSSCLFVFLGDYVDRGPDSRGVIDRLIRLWAERQVVALKGNHEAFLLQFFDRPEIGPSWMRVGGAATLASYGVRPAPTDDEGEWRDVRDQLARALPSAHLGFLQTLGVNLHMEGHLFVHAGIRPNVPLDQQSEEDMLWIRRPFLDHRGPLGQIVVFGHSVGAEPQIDVDRIGIDTGAYATGVLTCLRVLEDRHTLIQTDGCSARTTEIVAQRGRPQSARRFFGSWRSPARAPR